ncbi:ATP-dependent zinc metalloprotease FtsH [Aristaeella hokkaidonensis]|uniref:ATP-dependent zinc metalloprotease FtsH n=1 Tax=Aristaeella hokkaidonensis TaxID=3046382 RepID=A0AC61N2U9_9FIRM|nr:ATP-dependent zinc metalloprotease FtsH [Aristaeella hokkaidonensis]QUC68129.1 ATP-dependent zinc metalloprotease FtsH [Aristaeella hokkaidonensis]
MNRRPSRGIVGYVVLLTTLLLIAILLNGGLSQTVSRRIEYPQLLDMIKEGKVSRVAIRNNALVGVTKSTNVAADDFPERNYDFETTIGADFLDTVRQIEANKKNVPLDQVTVDQLSFDLEYRAPVVIPWWYDFLPYLIMLGIMAVIWFVMIRSQAGGGGKVMSFGKSRARMQDPTKNKITFADVAGADEEKEELQEMVDFLKNPRNYTELGARIPKGVLLVGPPGTGKTLLAKAVAGEAGVPFFSISGSDFVEMFVGVGASRVRDLFDQAKKVAPAIVFIDEIDAVGRHRGAGLGGGHDEREQTLNQLLVEMDGFAVNEGIIVMAATNRRDILDPALMRPGRFDRQVTVNYPDQNGRVAILKVHSKGKKLDDSVDLDNIAKRMPYATGADLENVMNEAAILAARARKKKIDQQLLIDAIARVQMGPEKKSHKVNEKDRRMVAIHEGGHAIIGHLLEGCDEVHLITIVPWGQAAGHTLALPAEEHDNMSRSQLFDQITMMLGGHAAEEVGLGEIYTGSSSDLKRATEICRKMVTQFGMSDNIGTIYLGSDQEVFVGMEFGQSREYSEEIAAKIDREVASILARCYEKAKKILTDNLDKLELLTQALLEQETLNRAEFVSLMETGEMPEATKEDKPRTAEEIIRESKEAFEAETDKEMEALAKDPAEAQEPAQSEAQTQGEA